MFVPKNVIALTVCILVAAYARPADAINVQPIQICDDAGTDCAVVSTFSDYTNKIYAQIGQSVTFLPVKVLKSSKYLDLTVPECDELIHSASGTQQRTTGAYDMWFAKSLDGRWGRSTVGADGIAISNAIIGANRVDTVAHELGHNLGFGHSDSTIVDAPRYLMAEGTIRKIPTALADVAPDGLQLDRFAPSLPQISVDTIGSTPFESTNFFHVQYKNGAASDVALKKLTINLGPAGAFTDPTNTAPGLSGSPFGFSGLTGIATSDISVSGIADGSTQFSLSFANGAFTPGDSFSFGVDIDLSSNIDGFGATPTELKNTVVTFEFNNNYTVSGSLDDLIATTTFDPTANYDKPALVFADPEYIPEPTSMALLVMGMPIALSRKSRQRTFV